MAEGAPTHEELLEGLQRLASRAALRFALPPGVSVRLINLSENATYCVQSPLQGARWALRVHRAGYHSRTAIASELLWQQALAASGAIITPKPVKGLDGDFIQTVAGDSVTGDRNVVLFTWEEGKEPAENDVGAFELLGETAARMHAHVKSWSRSSWFERHTWDFETTLGASPHWGRWRDGMGMTDEIEQLFAETVDLIGRRLQRFGKGPGRFGLVHGDMRLANLLLEGDKVKVIDFDDCGLSWYLYDCATTVSFFEDSADVPDLLKAWVRGYRRIGRLDPDDENEIPTFVMLRRLLLVAWIGSHSETELAQAMGVAYTRGTVPLCKSYLAQFGAEAPSVTEPPPKPGIWQRLFSKG